MTERQQQRRARAMTCAYCTMRYPWPDQFPDRMVAMCAKCYAEIVTEEP